MQTRTKTFADVANWSYFFRDVNSLQYDEKALKKLLSDTNVRGAVESFGQELAGKTAVKAEEIEQMIRSAETKFGIAQGKLNQPLRIAVTGSTIGAGIYETIELIGAEHSAERIRHALALEIH